jgi:DNA-binding transcriptional regulator YdaS (Cro superfamily)
LTTINAEFIGSSMEQIVKQVIDKAGGPSAMARSLNISTQAIWKWKAIPIKRLAEIEKLTGIPRAHLRPDIFGKTP